MNNLEKVGCVKIPELFDAPTMSVVAEYFENKIAREELKIDYNLNGPNKPTKIYYYADPLIEVLLKKALPFIEEVVEEKILPTYSYFRIYEAKEELIPHRDRPACEISVSVNIASGKGKNKIYMESLEGIRGFELNSGDGVVYKGCEVKHWREPLKEEDYVMQFMLHYVKEKGRYASHVFDQRTRLGEKSCL